MNKFNFLKKRKPSGDSLQQQELAKRYFDELQLKNQQPVDGAEPFDQDKVFSRINLALNEIEQRKNNIGKKLAVACSLLVIVGLAAISYQYRTQILDKVDPVAVKTLTAANGQMVSYTLADGTKLWLNGGSKLIYPERFRGAKREITLEGEAFFDVAHKSDQPFIIHTGHIQTQVLGTSFNVKAYPEDAFVQVDVVTGKVGVLSTPKTAAKQQAVLLTPRQELRVNKSTLALVKQENVDVQLSSGWKDGELVFKQAALKDVLSSLRRRFNVEINADPNLAGCSISANFTNVSFSHIMEIISKLVKGNATPEGKGYHLRGKGC
ncbi:FecR domain-containing protein [Mucilaginibacter sp. RS28]|uniref:FecR domain-containing protein n=1 Tax=Mucilaginibacter straminoryzae TaxID=2932774 RepID=A0A9X2B7W3_9SPHI|nr:FecR domain-containing protein [Mucilaginibacter straminoryzae]MCJ8209024.1 FecR domain-containing protein [Mucilaginibacter straminoryzae]